MHLTKLLSTPELLTTSYHLHWVEGLLGLFDGVHLGGHGAHYGELSKARAVGLQAVLQSQAVTRERGDGSGEHMEHKMISLLELLCTKLGAIHRDSVFDVTIELCLFISG